MAEFYYFLKDSKAYKAYQRDLTQWRQSVAFLKRPISGHLGNVLVPFMNNTLAGMKFESMFSRALQERGYLVTIILDRNSARGMQYFKAAGITHFAFIEDYIHASPELEKIKVDCWNALLANFNFHSLIGITIDGINVGQYIASTLYAQQQARNIDLNDQEIRRIIKRLLDTTLEQIQAIKRLYANLPPQFVVFLEKGYLPWATFYSVALSQKLKVIQWLHSNQPNDAYILKKFNLDNQRIHPYSLSPITWEKVKKFALGRGQRSGI